MVNVNFPEEFHPLYDLFNNEAGSFNPPGPLEDKVQVVLEYKSLKDKNEAVFGNKIFDHLLDLGTLVLGF